MGQNRDYNRRNRQSRLSAATWTRLSSLVCLFLLLALFFVPLTHQCLVHSLEGPHSPLAPVPGKQVGLQLSAPEPAEQNHHHHDAASCSICQTALNSRYFAVPTLSLLPILPLPVQRYYHRAFTSIFTNPDTLVSGPRAPPVSL
ncbi:MAG: DUF2946 family protein [Desulfobaccales bacterium]